jgi:hypothetical protein
MDDENELRPAAESKGEIVETSYHPRVMDKIALRELLGRLENEVGPADQGIFSAWEDDEHLTVRAGAGALHLREAAIEARRALESGDDEKIRIAAQICPALERIGQELARKILVEAHKTVLAGAARDAEREQAEIARNGKAAKAALANQAMIAAIQTERGKERPKQPWKEAAAILDAVNVVLKSKSFPPVLVGKIARALEKFPRS